MSVITSPLQDLQPLFDKFGDVGDIYLPKDRESGRSARPLANHSENKS